MAMSLPLSPLSSVSDIQSPVSTSLNPTVVNSNGSPQQQQQQQQQQSQDKVATQTAATTTTTTANIAVSTTPASPIQMKRKPSRRANTAERRATHNAVERQRRETLNGRFLDLASLLPNLSQIRRPSKSSIVNSSIAYIHGSRRHHLLASRELRSLKTENDHLRFEINEWRDRAGLIRIEEPVRSEGFGIVISGQMEVIQATLKGGLGSGRVRRGGRGGDEGEGDEDEDEDDGEDGMIGLGGYGGSYMDDVEDEIILEEVDGSEASQLATMPSATPPSSMPPPSSTTTATTHQMHLHHVHQQQQQQQQQMTFNTAAAAHHSHHGHPLEDRIANLLIKNGNGNSNGNPFPQPSASTDISSNFAFHQQQQQHSNTYNSHQQQQQQQQYQHQQTFPSSYLPDKSWNDPHHHPHPQSHSQAQYPGQASTHQMMQAQAPRSLFTPSHGLDAESHHQHQQQQYHHHQPNLSANTSIGVGVDSPNDMINNGGKANIRMAVKTKVANAKANDRVKARNNGMSHSHFNGNAVSSPPHTNSTGNSPLSSTSGVGGIGSTIPSPAASSASSSFSSPGNPMLIAPPNSAISPSHSLPLSRTLAQAQAQLQMRRSGSPHNHSSTSGSGSGSESGASPNYELHSTQGDYGVPRRGSGNGVLDHVGFMGLGGMSMGGGGGGGMNMSGLSGTYGGHENGAALMMMMM